MKRILILSQLILALAACNTPNTQRTQEYSAKTNQTTKQVLSPIKYSLDSTNLKRYSLTQITEEYFNKYTHLPGEEVKRDSIHKKTKGILKLPLTNGKYYLTKDEGKGGFEDFMQYEYIGQLKSINQYLVCLEQYESMSYLLIDKQSGKETSIGSTKLVLSPKYSKLISIDPYDDMSYSEPPYICLAVYNIRAKKLIPDEAPYLTIRIKHTDDKYRVFPEENYEICWEDENTVLIKLTFTGNGNSKYSDYLRLHIK